VGPPLPFIRHVFSLSEKHNSGMNPGAFFFFRCLFV